MTRLSKRLQAIASMVTPGNRLADIGTDHGYLPLYLLEQGLIPVALAMDVNQGPLDRAREHIAEHSCKDYIETRLSDGLMAFLPGEADTIVIAGMGGGLMVRILTKESGKLEGVKELILQPQSEQGQVRRVVRELGFVIVDEDMLMEDGKYYVMLRAVPQAAMAEGAGMNGMSEEERISSECRVQDIKRQELQDLYGPVLLVQKHPVLKEWLQREIGICHQILERLDQSASEETGQIRRQEILDKLDTLCAAADILR